VTGEIGRAAREPGGRLGRLFAPRAIALVGVPGDLDRPGARPLRHLRAHGYTGRIYPVNPRYPEIGGLPAYPTLETLPERPDVAWIGLPAAQSAEAIAACGRAGVPFAVVLAAGFAETGAAGAEAQAQLADCARRAGVRLLGPNTVGYVNAWDGVALTFSTVGERSELPPGALALLSQSGGLGGCVLDRAADRGIGVGLFVSTGNEADLSLADYLEWLVEDGRARAIACLVEQIRDPERVAGAVARAAGRGVSVVALKIGASETGARAARSHTGSLAGRRDAWRAWAQAVGVVEVAELDHLAETAAALARAPALGGPRAAMVTSSGGVGALLADAIEPHGYVFPPFAAATAARVGPLLPEYATVANPLDITAGLPDRTFGEVLSAVADDPGVDVVLVPLTMATARAGAARAEEVIRAAARSRTPVVVCWPGGGLVRDGVALLAASGVPVFSTVASCAAALAGARARRTRRGRPPAAAARGAPVRASGGPGPLPWPAVRGLLVGAGLTVVAERIVRSAAEVDEAAATLAYPVAVKALGPARKTDVGAVRLDVDSPGALVAAVRALLPLGEACLIQPMVRGVEVLVGALRDRELGAFVMVGPGGVQVELYGERALAPAPCDAAEARRLVAACRMLDALLSGYRGAPAADRAALVEAVVRASHLAAELGPALTSFDLNPVIVGPPGRGAIVVDARVLLEA
jgi:acyl-CoA synthetase (NDP forming)